MKRRIISLFLCLALALALRAPARAGARPKYVGADYPPILAAALENLYFEVTDPESNSTGGEWAVLALARGGWVDEAWYGRYMDALNARVEERRGVLSAKVYTEYSRTIIGLSAIGQDATKLNTGSGVYDLVTPLTERQPNGKLMASRQGNNGTIFALIAMDTQNYLDNDLGNGTRKALLDEILNVQLSSGAWEISKDTGPDIDMTAMALQALAPYLRNKTKFNDLKTTHTYAQLQDIVDKGLQYLKTREANDYNSVEAAAQVVVALAALDRDAAADALLGDVVGKVLAYYDSEGSFAHDHSGSAANTQMSLEQAAYALVAYDRWKNGKTSLYDMTDCPTVSAINISVTSPATATQTASGKITVTCAQACTVIAVLPDGSYVKLNPEGSGDSRTFHTIQGQVIIRLTGDYNGDGSVETLDLATANRALINSGVGQLEALVMGAGNGVALETLDLAKLNQKLIKGTKIDW